MEDGYLIAESGVLRDVFGNISFSEFTFDQINNHCKRISQIDGVSGKCLTFEKMFDNAKRLAASLELLGVMPGETITVSSENRLEYSSVLLACVFTGTVFAPINPMYLPDEIIHTLNISKPRVVFCSAFTLKNITAALASLKGVSQLVLFDDDVVPPNSPVRTVKLTSLLECLPIYKPRQCRDEDIAVVLASSGTTGLPKGVMLSYVNLKYLCSFCMDRNLMNLTQNVIVMGLVPLYHGYGYSLLLTTMLCGAKCVLLPKFEDKLFLSTIQKYKITNLYLVPPLMTFLANHPMVLQFDLSSVREVVCGAAPLSREIIQRVLTRLPAADVRQGYGMTELSVVITITPSRCNVLDSVGKLAPTLSAKIVDVETGQPLGRNHHGELWVRGACVMAGYCRNTQATRDTVDATGWLHTGDIGYVDHQGYFYIVDRIKELIKYKGYQVAPAELEAVLMSVPGVSDAAVVGLPDATAGEFPVAYVVRQPQANVTREDIINHVNGKVSPQKRLRDVRFIDKIPRNTSGKILRNTLKKLLSSKL